MLTMREVTEDGFGAKVRDWNKSELVQEWRERWAEHVNERLASHSPTQKCEISHLPSFHDVQDIIQRTPQQFPQWPESRPTAGKTADFQYALRSSQPL
jgi:hypothetical protein